MKRLVLFLSIPLLAVMSAAIALAQSPELKTPTTSPPTQTDKSQAPSTGYRGVSGQIAIGEAAPGFELTRADGLRIRLSTFVGTRVLLCFADRRDMVAEYGPLAESLGVSGVRLVAIARDSPRSLKAMAERDSLAFDLLSDPTGEISAIYGSYDAGTSSIRPGYVLIGRTSVVRMAILGQRLPPGELLHITRYALTGL
jgi:peroxiredoxin